MSVIEGCADGCTLWRKTYAIILEEQSDEKKSQEETFTYRNKSTQEKLIYFMAFSKGLGLLDVNCKKRLYRKE
jgi:hypothetical protein